MTRSAAVLGCAFLLGLACGGGLDDNRLIDRSEPLVDAGRRIGDGGEMVNDESCPEDEPKVGEACPPRFEESVTCEYQVGECTGPGGASYAEYVTYCCVGKIWRMCGGRSACDAFDGGVSPPPGDGGPDGGAAIDAPVSPDAPVDAPVDAAPDTAAPVAPDAPAADAAPDAVADTADPADAAGDAAEPPDLPAAPDVPAAPDLALDVEADA